VDVEELVIHLCAMVRTEKMKHRPEQLHLKMHWQMHWQRRLAAWIK